MKEKTVKTVSKEEIEKVINTLSETEVKYPEDAKLNIAKVKEVISNFEGCTPHTVVGVCTTALLLLPTGTIMAVIDMAKKAFAAKAMSELAGIIGKDCPDCNCECADAPEAPEE